MNREEAEKKVRENKCEYPGCINKATDHIGMFLCDEHSKLKTFIQKLIDE